MITTEIKTECRAVGNELAYDMAVLAYRENNFKRAVELLRDFTQSNKYHWNALFFLGMAEAQLNMPMEACKHFRSIVELCPDITLRRRAELAQEAVRIWQH